MANREQVALLRKWVGVWNAWRAQSDDIQAELSEADLSEANLTGANLTRANTQPPPTSR